MVLPVDGLKEEEPVEPYQKIGPSKTGWLFSLQKTLIADLPTKTKGYVVIDVVNKFFHILIGQSQKSTLENPVYLFVYLNWHSYYKVQFTFVQLVGWPFKHNWQCEPHTLQGDQCVFILANCRL